MQIKIKNVRLSFPNLFKTASFGGEDTGKYDATFILDKKENADNIKEIQEGIKVMLKEKFPKTPLSADKLCLKDGDDKGRDEMKNAWMLKASTKRRPLVINKDRTPLTEADNVIYAGCYVNAIITLWAQDNKYGKRINASLEGVQFYKDGEPLGGGGIDVVQFDAFGDDTGSDDIPF